MRKPILPCKLGGSRGSYFVTGLAMGILFGLRLVYIPPLTLSGQQHSTASTPLQFQQRNFTDNRTGSGPMVAPEPNPTIYYSKTLQGKGVIAREAQYGIGNQLFVYACMYALAKDLGRPLYNFIPKTQLFSDRKFINPKDRSFALDKFQIPLDNFIDSSTNIGSSVLDVNDAQLLFRNYPTDSSFLVLAGGSYCQSYALWSQHKDEILAMFQLKPEVVQAFPSHVQKLVERIQNSEDSVAVHVRRGDFTSNPDAWAIPISYQRDSIKKIAEMIQARKKGNSSSSSPTFFIFSDDTEYCREEFRDLAQAHKLIFVSSPVNGSRTTSLEDFFMMTQCKHFIIPNSTFGWWAAYLATQVGPLGGSSLSNQTTTQDRIVIASEQLPNFWKEVQGPSFYKNVVQSHAYFLKGWIIHTPS